MARASHTKPLKFLDHTVKFPDHTVTFPPVPAANAGQASARPPRMNPSGLPPLGETDIGTYEWWKLPGTATFTLKRKGKAGHLADGNRYVPGAGKLRVRKNAHKIARPDPQVRASLPVAPTPSPPASGNAGAAPFDEITQPTGRGTKTLRPADFGENEPAIAKWPRLASFSEPTAPAPDMPAGAEPPLNLLAPTQPDWQLAQSKYLNAVLWQDD